MDLYPFLEWLHIVNAAVLFGTGLGSAFYMWLAHKTENITTIAGAVKIAGQMDKVITLPAAIIQPVTGVLMIVFVGFPWDAPWLVVSYALYLLAGLMWLRVLVTQPRAQALAQAAAKSGKSLPPEYFAKINIWFRFCLGALVALFVIFFLMVHKPDLWLYS